TPFVPLRRACEREAPKHRVKNLLSPCHLLSLAACRRAPPSSRAAHLEKSARNSDTFQNGRECRRSVLVVCSRTHPGRPHHVARILRLDSSAKPFLRN